MKTILEILTKIVSEAFEHCGYDKEAGRVLLSDRPDLCQFQCNGSFDCAKKYKAPPFVIAEKVADVLSGNEIFQSVEVVRPGFINIILRDKYILEIAEEIAGDANCGIPQAETPETIVLDYGGPNIAKPLHIGHLRAAIIGEALKRIARATGRKVISDVHLGDWGLQIGLVIAELKERHPEWKCFSADFDSKNDSIPEIDVNDLNEIYPFASQKSKENEEFKESARRITSELQNGHEGYIALWKEIKRVSVDDLKENYRKLNIDFDLWYGESDSEKYVDRLLDILSREGLLYESDGALVVDVAEEADKATVPPVIIKKSDNSNIYATTDLATIIQRQEDFSPEKIWYVVDNRQSLHFTQVFRCAKKAKLVPETTELIHLGFGTMNGSDGKPYKTRDGGVMRLSDLLSTIYNAALEKIKTSEFISAEERSEVAAKIAIAAVKFGDLINHRTKDYVFDIDKFLSFEGKTGTYLLYTITRINSILNKVDEKEARFNAVYSDTERELLLNIIVSGEAFNNAIKEKAPNHICENAYKLAALFSQFYRDSHIINETDEKKKSTWIALCKITKAMLQKHLEVLGIDFVESM